MRRSGDRATSDARVSDANTVAVDAAPSNVVAVDAASSVDTGTVDAHVEPRRDADQVESRDAGQDRRDAGPLRDAGTPPRRDAGATPDAATLTPPDAAKPDAAATGSKALGIDETNPLGR